MAKLPWYIKVKVERGKQNKLVWIMTVAYPWVWWVQLKYILRLFWNNIKAKCVK